MELTLRWHHRFFFNPFLGLRKVLQPWNLHESNIQNRKISNWPCCPVNGFTHFSRNGGPLDKYLINGRGMFRWLGARTVPLCDGKENQYAQYLTADLSHVTGGTKPDNQAEEEEDWEEGGVVQWHCRQRAPGKKVFEVWVHLIHQLTLKSNQCSSFLFYAAFECCWNNASF